MSRVGQRLLFPVAARSYRRRHRNEADGERRRSPEDYWKWQWDSSEDLFSLYRGLDVRGKQVLEIGCGIGGRTAWLMSRKPERVLALDISAEAIRTARRLQRRRIPDSRSRLEFRVSGERYPELPSESVDTVLIVDTLEHVRDPRLTLSEAFRLLRPGGELFFGTSGWYHHSAAHMSGYLPVPWLTLFFSDRTILDTARHVMHQEFYRPGYWDSDPPWRRWEGVDDLRDRPGEHLNKVTIHQLRRDLKSLPFRERELRVVGFRRGGILRSLNLMSHVPLLREFWHSYLVGHAVK